MAGLSTLITSWIPEITPSPRFELQKRAEVCGDLQGQYPHAVAPTCTGSYSICTFSAGQQGCCDASNRCQFYTSCNGGLASGTARCTASACLQCQTDAPYCTQYRFAQGNSAYAGFACGKIELSAYITVQGIATSAPALTTSSSMSSGNTTSRTMSSTSGTNQTIRTSANSSTTSSSIIAMATGEAQTPTASTTRLSAGEYSGIVIGAIGGLAVLIFMVFLIRRFYLGNSTRRNERPMLEPLRHR